MLKEKSHYSADQLRTIYPSGHFKLLDVTPLLKILHLPLGDKRVRMALNKTIKINFLTEYHGTIYELDSLAIATVCWVVKEATEYLLKGGQPREIKRPGKWMTITQAAEEKKKRLENEDATPDRLFYAPTCKKGGRGVQS
jgi:hypothetical protein